MFRVDLNNVFAKRTIKPKYERYQATPVAANLDSTEALAGTGIYSGMVSVKTSSGTLKVADGATAADAALSFGLFALDSNSVIDDLNGQPSDLKPFAVWQGGPNAYFQVRSPAFDNAQTYAVADKLFPGTGGVKGKLTNNTAGLDAGRKAVAEVIAVNSDGSLEIRLAAPQAL